MFRGSDVKDISIADEEEKPAPHSVPDDPAILGVSEPKFTNTPLFFSHSFRTSTRQVQDMVGCDCMMNHLRM